MIMVVYYEPIDYVLYVYIDLKMILILVLCDLYQKSMKSMF